MHESPTGKTAIPAPLVTHTTEFLSCSPSGQALLAVQGGIAAEEAASRASSCLAAALEILEKEGDLSDAAHGALTLTRMAKALVNSLKLDAVG